MGEVYRARDARLGRDVAVKVIGRSIADDPALLARFEREARAVAALNHPNVITIHEIGDSNGSPFIAFELIEGETLRDRLLQRRMPLEQVLDVAVQVAD